MPRAQGRGAHHPPPPSFAGVRSQGSAPLPAGPGRDSQAPRDPGTPRNGTRFLLSRLPRHLKVPTSPLPPPTPPSSAHRQTPRGLCRARAPARASASEVGWCQRVRASARENHTTLTFPVVVVVLWCEGLGLGSDR